MLYFYKYPENHKIEELNKFLNYFFETLFKEKHKAFSIKNFVPDNFQPACKECSSLLNNNLQKIFNQYSKLKAIEKKEIIDAFQANQDIEKICTGQAPFQYGNRIRKRRPKTATNLSFFELLKDFLDALWLDAFKNDSIISICGDVKQHFNDFCKLNKDALVCPFCGLEKLPNEYTKERPPYDHYLNKGDYPFVSVNFKNLAPICSTCNGPNYKHSKDIVEGGRKAFFPYNSTANNIEIKISSSIIDIENDKTLQIVITNSGSHIDEIDTWDNVFGIKGRYIAELKKRADRIRGHIYSKYRQNKDFVKTQEDIKFEVERPFEEPGSIVRKIYYDHFFSAPEIEKHLEESCQP